MLFFKAWRSKRKKAPAGCTALTVLYQSSQWLMQSLKSQLQNFFSAYFFMMALVEIIGISLQRKCLQASLQGEWDVMIYQCKACCSAAADTGIIVFFSLRATQLGDSRAQSGKSVISSGIPQNVPQHWLDWTVFETGIQIPEAEMGGQNALKLCLGKTAHHKTRIFSTGEEMSLHVLCKILSHHKESGSTKVENSPPVLAVF